MRILLIDDDKDICELTKKILFKNGYLVDAFYDAKAGIKHAHQFKPNLILMDVMMPGTSGPEAIKLLKEDSNYKNIPVIFLTGLVSGDEDGMEGEGLMAGGVRYPTLGKPYEIEALLAIVKKFAM